MTPSGGDAAVGRACFAVRLHPGTEAVHDARMAELAPALGEALAAAGLREVSVFRRGIDAWWVLRADWDGEAAVRAAARSPAMAAWARGMRSVIVDAQSPDHRSWYRPMFFTPGRPQPGPFRRELLALVIDPDRGEEYDARHAAAWPEMLDAIAAAGSRDSTGFRRGAQVVFSGAHHPDLATVYERISAIEVDGRWGDSFAGIITTMTDADGRLLIAPEVGRWETEDPRGPR